MTFHNTSFKSIGLILFGWIIFFPEIAFSKVDQREADIREKALQTASSPSDSIKILLDVYNLSDQLNRNKIRVQIIDLTQRSDSEEVIKSVLRELSTSTDDADELDSLLILSESLPANKGREEMQTVLQMEQAESEASKVNDSAVEKQIAEYARQGFNLAGDPYKEIQNIYRAMTYLGASSQGPLYFEYIKRLEELVDALPAKDHAIKDLYYTTAALFYTRKRDHAKAIHFDKLLIKQLDDMTEYYKSIGDTIHNLDYYYYVSYRRLLRNFKGLTPEEVEDIYNKCLELSKKNAKVAGSFGTGGLSKSYYYMSKNDYKNAIPELNKALSSDKISKYRRRELLGLLSEAYRETGNPNGELKALREYSALQLEDREERLNDMYREIELRNSVSKLINEEYKQESQQRQENKVMRKTSLTLVYVLAVILIFLCGAYLRLRTKVKELEINNNRLHRNIEHIFDDGVPKGSKDIRHQKNRLK